MGSPEWIHRATNRNVADLGGFPIVYADPPWSYDDPNCNGGVKRQYQTMSLDDICDLPVEKMVAPDACLFLWATYPKLPEAFVVAESWGFDYKSIAFQWVKTYPSGKPVFGLGRWTRGNTEPCLLFTRGKPKRESASVSQLVLDADHLVVEPRGKHSEKPARVRDLITDLCGDKPAIELFARQSAPGWENWGNQCESTVELY